MLVSQATDCSRTFPHGETIIKLRRLVCARGARKSMQFTVIARASHVLFHPQLKQHQRVMISFQDTVRVAYSSQSHGAALNDSATSRIHVHEMMKNYMDRADIDSSSLKVVHVAGTKGKGSTCAFTESILRQHGLRTGLFTSPHLVDIRERFRINGAPISKDKFTRYFWEIWNKLNDTQHLAEGKPFSPMPAYFRLMYLVGLHIFEREGVDVAILEVGIGGRLDATNVVHTPVVTGVTTLDFDHVQVLGSTLQQIAFEKAGIFKPGVPAFAVAQRTADADRILQEVAEDVGAPFEQLHPSQLATMAASASHSELELGLPGRHQLTNARVAVALCRTFLEQTGNLPPTSPGRPFRMPFSFMEGLRSARWPGRAHQLYARTEACTTEGAKGTITIRAVPASDLPADTDRADQLQSGELVSVKLDGAHTAHSMVCAMQWIQSATASAPTSIAPAASTPLQPRRVLIFNCSHEKDVMELVLPVTAVGWDAIYLCPFRSARPSRHKPPAAEDILVASLAEIETSGTLAVGDSKAQLSIHEEPLSLAEIKRLAGADGTIGGDIDDPVSADAATDDKQGPTIRRAPMQQSTATPVSPVAGPPSKPSASMTAALESAITPEAHGGAAAKGSVAWQHVLLNVFKGVYSNDKFTPIRSQWAHKLAPDGASGAPLSTPTDWGVFHSVEEALGAAVAKPVEDGDAAPVDHSSKVPVEIVVTGSLYLVGDALDALGWSCDDEEP